MAQISPLLFEDPSSSAPSGAPMERLSMRGGEDDEEEEEEEEEEAEAEEGEVGDVAEEALGEMIESE